jgi:hypothetical protein
MPQVSLYLEEGLLVSARREAKHNRQSFSKYVATALEEKKSSSWPAGYFSLFGALKDDTFVRPMQPSFDDDAPRQQL